MHIHPPIFVASSALIACLGSWTALDLFRRVHAHTGFWRGAWLVAAAAAMGLSIWAMHFVAMLGFNPGADVRYDVPLTLLSLLLPIAVTAFAFFSAAERGREHLIIGGLVMGAGICIMHYVGMSALITSATLTNETLYVVLAFLVAVFAAISALLVARRERTFLQRAGAALVLGFAIVGMHYTAMAGVRVTHTQTPVDVVPGGIDAIALAMVVTAGTLFILLLTLIAALSDRRLEAAAAEKVAAEARAAHALAEKADAQAALLHAQRLESLGRLTGGVAHDFNNLLTVVIGALDIILRQPENHERRKRLGEAALAAAKRGERLTAQLLAFARRQPLQPVSSDLNELVRECEPLIRGVAHEKLALDLRLCGDGAVALIDPTQFEALLLNLIVNAVDATPAGGRISIATRVRALEQDEVPGLAAGRYFQLDVSDTGQGMSQEVMSRIFEPFFTTKTAGKGTGLGLSQVYGFVRQSGGEVHVHSTPGSGTRFTICLPVREGQAAEPIRRPAAIRRQEHSLRVLLAEDDASVATITETMLRNLGHDVLRVENADQALSLLRSATTLDLLMSDVIMPGGMNGVELAREAATLRPGIKVLLCSGYAGESVDRALAAGSWPFLRKPYLQDELAALLQRFFEPATRQLIAG
ncbi:response regulator [Steroidobacter sp. S1-65]|uniref:histidine kinase n=1 Tax=Steroidobacter gossypii TaxID=2805490 RepID=A0ABS1WQZ9_9GAMM|nr:MHYT domain-containing protein [Steroidobacter gossypii]MBM0103398.1 response regulator [Steroidobacter gossypii]